VIFFRGFRPDGKQYTPNSPPEWLDRSISLDAGEIGTLGASFAATTGLVQPFFRVSRLLDVARRTESSRKP
jgi:hypothetical protein